MTSAHSVQAEWDYTTLAAHYDRRADYAEEAINEIIALTCPHPSRPIAEIGAGTGKLTKLLLTRGFAVHAVEPNHAMRHAGIRNTAGRDVTWTAGTGEETGLPGAAYDLAAFGSSFNVVDRSRALVEVSRILRPRGWFVCLWNHRDLLDPIQARVEAIIRQWLPHYDYGERRADQTAVICESHLFEPPVVIERAVAHTMAVGDYVDAWRSHATLMRQAAGAFDSIVRAIADSLVDRTVITVPYTTRVWCARHRR